MWRKGWTRPGETDPVTLCNACGILYKRGWFCVHCEEVYRKVEGADDDAAAGPSGPWIGCDHCERWSHLSCELARAPDAVRGSTSVVVDDDDAAPPEKGGAGSGGLEDSKPSPDTPDASPTVFDAALASEPYRCPECRGKDRASLAPPRAVSSHASQTSVAAGAHVAEGRVVHNRPFLRSGDRRGGGAGGGGGSGRGPAIGGSDGDGAVGGGGGAIPKGKRSRGGARKPAVRYDPGAGRSEGRLPRRLPRPAPGVAKRIGRSYALGKRKLPPPPPPPPSSSPLAPTISSFVPVPLRESPLLASSSSLFRDGGRPSPTCPPGIVGGGVLISDRRDVATAGRWASRVASVAADAERRRGCAPAPTAAPHAGHVGGGGMGTPSGLSLLRGGGDPTSISISPPGSIFTVENLTGGGGAAARVPRASPASHASAAATRAFIAARDWADPVDPRMPHYRFLAPREVGEAAAPAPSFGVSPEFGSSSALDNLAPCSDEIHCRPRSTARMPPPITPALLEPRAGLLGGAAESAPRGRGPGSRLDFGDAVGEYGEDDLMEPDDVEVSGVNGERFEDLREAARLLGRRAAMEGLATGVATLSASPPDSSGSGERDEPPVCSPPLPRDVPPHGAPPPPDEASTCGVLAHLSLASSATRELVRRTGAARPVAALLLGSGSAAVREAAARLACSPAWRDAIAEAATEDAVGFGGSARAVEWSVRRGGGVRVGGGTGGGGGAGSPFFVAGSDRGLDDGDGDGDDGDDGDWGDGDGDGDDESAPLERTGSVLSASRLEPRPAGSGGIKGRELRNSVM